MEAAVMVGGLALEAGAWWLVAARRRDVWAVTVPVLVAMGVAAALVRSPTSSGEVPALAAASLGAASGAALYLATRLFVAVVRPWETFGRHSLTLYLRQGAHSLGWALVVSVALTVPGEELFWRGLFQGALVDAFGGRAGLAAAAGWVAYVAANLPSANLAIVAGAVVGGGVWASLGWWSGGVLAPLFSHAVWTALMLSLPVVRSEPVA